MGKEHGGWAGTQAVVGIGVSDFGFLVRNLFLSRMTSWHSKYLLLQSPLAVKDSRLSCSGDKLGGM